MARAHRSTTTGRFTKGGGRSTAHRAGGTRRGRAKSATRGRRTASGWLRAGGG